MGLGEFQARVDTLVGHDHCVMQVKVHPHNAFLVATASLDRIIKIWNLDLQGRHNYCRSSLAGQQQALVVSWRPLSRLSSSRGGSSSSSRLAIGASSSEQYAPYLVSGSDDCTIRVWNYQTLELLHTMHDVHVNNANPVLFCKTASCLVSASQDGQVVLWHVPTWQPIQTFSHGMGFAWNLAMDN